jgi:hypothetical protein
MLLALEPWAVWIGRAEFSGRAPQFIPENFVTARRSMRVESQSSYARMPLRRLPNPWASLFRASLFSLFSGSTAMLINCARFFEPGPHTLVSCTL